MGRNIVALPATARRWSELTELFGRRGAYGGCWCVYWRVKRGDFDRMGTQRRRAKLRSLTRRARPPGILYYETTATSEPIGWCSLGPRADFPVLARSPVLKPVDDLPTWSIVCFYVRETYRGVGLFRSLVDLATAYARERGAPRIEAYPRDDRWSGPEAYMGVSEVYRSLGFREIARRRKDRPVLRLELGDASAGRAAARPASA